MGAPGAEWAQDAVQMAEMLSDALSTTICNALGLLPGRAWHKAPQPEGEEDKHLLLPGPDPARVCFTLLGEGSWNRTYSMEMVAALDKDCDNDDDDNNNNEVKTEQDQILSQLVLRVSLPVMPGYKVASEVATMEWVRRNTCIPVPRVWLYNDNDADADADTDNSLEALGYAWILMDRVAGVPYAELHDTMPLNAKVNLAHTLADWVHELASCPFHLIGSLYIDPSGPAHGSSSNTRHPAILPAYPLVQPRCPSSRHTQAISLAGDDLHFVIGPLVDQKLFGDWRLEYDLCRGPFSTAHAFAKALVACQLAEVRDPRQRFRTDLAAGVAFNNPAAAPSAAAAAAAAHGTTTYSSSSRYCSAGTHKTGSPVCLCTSRYPTAGYMDEYESTCMSLDHIINLAAPPTPLDPRDRGPGTVLYHWDLSEDNLIVDPATGRATGVIDWEQLRLVPIPLARYYPSVIEPGQDAPEEPVLPTSSWDDTTGTTTTGTTATAKPQWRVEEEMRWHRRLMRDVFDARLQELNSPWLDAPVQADFDGNMIGGRRRQALHPGAHGIVSGSGSGCNSGHDDRPSSGPAPGALAWDIIRHAMRTSYRYKEVEKLGRQAALSG